MANNGTVLSLDVGERRIGVARGWAGLGLANPLTTLINTTTVNQEIQQLCAQEQAQALVVGLPRNLQGAATAQTAYTEQFVTALRAVITVPIYFQDEAVTSAKAEAELRQRGKPYQKGEVDALAATYILEDFLRNPPAEFHG